VADFPNYKEFCATPQKFLDMRRFCTYTGAGTLRFGTLAQEDLANLKKFAPHPQKRLDILRLCTYTGASNTIAFSLRFRTGARAPKIWIFQDFSRGWRPHF